MFKAAMHELLKIQYFHQQKFNTNKIIQSEGNGSAPLQGPQQDQAHRSVPTFQVFAMGVIEFLIIISYNMCSMEHATLVNDT
jgi:hypothetical protein